MLKESLKDYETFVTRAALVVNGHGVRAYAVKDSRSMRALERTPNARSQPNASAQWYSSAMPTKYSPSPMTTRSNRVIRRPVA